ncbi:thiamine ABC transporter substrate-binding protein [Cellulomonas gelida]|uniref:Thiamine ABC transporter substrate-binding protein n=1 Tax=Cellulomonas gelida TaxID=1712 RepID=A0A4Y3KL73_9CELL|nr:thiamine ABC transporter substrate-binding protein [Cellulomonas gelida]GEA84633.1 thiamine ABC transporter substrate-binding protein [Cellulomonas gelida]GGL38910.1 thiamine ABC transporter substrate-binding protein [Cellulomonas gelida]
MAGPTSHRRRTRALTLSTALGTALALALTGCSLTSSDEPKPATDATASPDAGATTGGTVTLVTHASFVLSDGLLESFTDETGIDVEVVQPGDAGALVNQLVLTKDAPLGDAVFGIDNSFASRAITEGVLAPYTARGDAAADAAGFAVEGDDDGALTAIDFGDVCLNVDTSWFAEHELAAPTSLDDLTKPEYKDLLVVPNAVTSSPGFAFLLATVGAKGAAWPEYWTALKANGLKVADGWSDAYFTDFSGGGGQGPRPVVLSYASSPPSTVPEGGTEPTTAALLDTCFRQVEYAGVLAGAQNPTGAQALIDFLLSDEVQADIPGSMYMYPVSSAVELPDEWTRFAPLAENPFEVAPAEIAANRDLWLTTWSDTVIG